MALFRPLIWLFNGSGQMILKLMGVEPTREHVHIHTADEIAILVEESGARAYAPLVAEERARLTALGNREQEARAQLRRALELYREVGATGHVRRGGAADPQGRLHQRGDR